MKHNPSNYIIPAVLLAFFVLISCAGHGNMSLVPRNETDALLDDLLSRTDQYVVHYHGNSQKLVSGILFDPKDDDRHIRPEGALWYAIDDAQAIAAIVNIILTTDEPRYFPNVYNVTHPDGDVYGYIITGWTGLVVKPVDERTLRIYGLKGPPEYQNIGPGDNWYSN